MQNLIICLESLGEISCFYREGKMLFVWSKKGFCFCFLPFKKGYYLIAFISSSFQYGEFSLHYFIAVRFNGHPT